jgi:SH3 domain protein
VAQTPGKFKLYAATLISMCKLRCVLTALLMSLSFSSGAASIYVVDEIQVGLHAERQLSSPVVVMVASGSELEVVERDGSLVRVKTTTGQVGWIDGAYTSTAQPVASRLLTAISNNEALRAELTDLRREAERLKSDLLDSEENRKRQLQVISRSFEEKLDAAQEAVKNLEQIQSDAKTQAEAVRDTRAAELKRLRQENADLREPNSDAQNSTISSGTLRDMQRLAEENRTLKAALSAGSANERALKSELAAQAEPAPAPSRGLRPPDTLESVEDASVYTQWLLAFLALFLLSIGAYWHDFSVRRRHGGYRL